MNRHVAMEAEERSDPQGERIRATLAEAKRAGLLGEKSARVGVRISRELVDAAKAQTGISKDSDLIEYALANIALKDTFAEAFRKSRGTVDPSIKLGY